MRSNRCATHDDMSRSSTTTAVMAKRETIRPRNSGTSARYGLQTTTCRPAPLTPILMRICAKPRDRHPFRSPT